MEKDREKWNRKHGEKADPSAASAIVRDFWETAPKGRALDIAAGLGRNALFLAEKGLTVDAVDISDVAMDRLRGRHPRLVPVRADLDTYVIPAGTYSLIVNVNFLNRRLFPWIRDGLAPGGVLIFETFVVGTETGEGPHNPEHLLRENELLHAFLSLRIRYYRERREARHGGEALVASLVAVKP